MNKNQIINAAKSLNESKLSSIKVKVVAIKEEDLKELFMSACEAVPEDKEEHLPDVVTNTYNTLRDEMEASEKHSEEETKPEPIREEEQIIKEKTQPKKSKETKTPFEGFKEKILKGKDSSFSNYINSLLLKDPPMTFDQIFIKVKEMSDKKSLKNYKNKGELTQHINYLKKKGYKFSETDKGIQLTGID